MKTLSRSIFVVLVYLVMIPLTTLGQDLQGEWHGTLHVQGTELRVIFHVIMKDDRYAATMDSPDQNAAGIKVTAIDFRYPKLKFEISPIGMVYEAEMSDNLISGTWRQSGQTFALALIRKEDVQN